ncbi:phosphatase PAP2 family protein [Humisphaera borealis]|uniref:Phosphatase PAP2 family protein n=1 Tax=Humisphaera borealis TaxID=2807512 RepID=A0A7M2WTQ0_9BACT|nr:phosphatase PAP2 family protein [Humisphaera borealis]QOV88895.1 phosphatase PAP2 family protein [Humisphaera borealis]
MTHRITRAIAWIGSSSGLVLTVVLAIVGGTWLFVQIADEVLEGDTQSIDERIVRALRVPDTDPLPTTRPDVPIGPRWLQESGRDITGLGGVAVLTLLIAAVAGYLLLVRKYHAMWLVLVATFGALVISTLLKSAFDRPRPGVSHFSYVYTSSFPSGHSMLSASVYLTLGILLTRLVSGRLMKFYFLAVALVITGLVGVSRVYMGVHYPTDVLAGWTAGLVWALLCWVVARYLQQRGKVESPETTGTERADIDETPPA